MDAMTNTIDTNIRRNASRTAALTYHENKALGDRCLAGALLVVSAPLILILMLLVRSTSSGAAIYRQVRVGKNGRRFEVYKIRTMYKDAEALSGPQWAVRGDPRISPVGRILRFLHLDELPQLVNVVRGEMSLVGPRPERPEFVAKLAHEIPHYYDRLAVLPGITGLAQINLPADDSLASVRRKVIVDRRYVESANVILDARILICTALRMIGICHGRAARWLRIEHEFSQHELSCEDTVVDIELSIEETFLENEPSVHDLSPSSRRHDGAELASSRYALAVAPGSANSAAHPVASEGLSRRPR